MKKTLLFLGSFLLLISTINAQVKLAKFGDYRLKNGEVLENTRIGYNTYGKLNPSKSNAILFATWYGGNGEDLNPYIGRESMIDTTKYYLVVVEALGNGISSSPSNTSIKNGSKFPEFSIEDMVDLQYKLLTETLKINHLYAVTGISMGGMQTYQWMASYPDFFDKGIPIVGTPELSVYDKLNFEVFKQLLTHNIENDTKAPSFLMLEYSLGLTPKYFDDLSESQEEFINQIKEEAKEYDPRDLYSQMLAISSYNPYQILKSKGAKSFADVFNGEALIIYSGTDNLLSPSANLKTARELETQSLDLNSKCGHYAFSCDREQISEAVSVFLK